MISRRRFLGSLGISVLGAALTVEAQQAEKIRRVGFLSAPSLPPPSVDAFRDGLRENGYVEGRNLLIEWRSAEGRDDRLPGFATELVSLKADVIFAVPTSAALAAWNATGAIPIVFIVANDPVALGLVVSLARPGGNLTGVTNLHVDITQKRIELVKEALPSLKSVVLLANPENPGAATMLAQARTAAHTLGLKVRVAEARRSVDLGPAFTTMVRDRANAVVVMPDPFLYQHRAEIAELATKGRLMTMAWGREWIDAGMLFSYGASHPAMYRRAADYVAKILKGARPADLPVEQPTKFELIINLKTAKALGLTIPPSLLLRADQVIK